MTDGTPLTLRVPKLALGVGSPEAEPAVGVQLLAAMEKTPARRQPTEVPSQFCSSMEDGLTDSVVKLSAQVAASQASTGLINHDYEETGFCGSPTISQLKHG
jgi:hypothetical protein